MGLSKKEILTQLDILVRSCQGTSLMIAALLKDDNDEEAFYFGAEEFREPLKATIPKFKRQPKYALNR